MTLHDMIILDRLDHLIRVEFLKENARGILCPRGCGERVFYSAADVVYLHANGAYLCGS